MREQGLGSSHAVVHISAAALQMILVQLFEEAFQQLAFSFDGLA